MPAPSDPTFSHAEHLRLVFDKGAVGAWELDIRTGVARRNLRHDEIFGYPALLPEWTYERFLDHVLPEDRDRVDSLFGEALGTLSEWSFECRVRRADGEQRWISAVGRPLHDAGGEVERMIGHVIDITHVKRDEERLRTLLHEMNHRVRNTLAILQSIARQTFRKGVDIEVARDAFFTRLQALSQVNDVLTGEDWSGAELGDVVRQALAPYGDESLSAFEIEGDRLRLSSRAAVSLGMVVNELTTNALKHGALTRPDGRVSVRWTVDGASGTCQFEWIERGGPPVSEPAAASFGTRLVRDLMPDELDGTAEHEFLPTGVRYRIGFPLN